MTQQPEWPGLDVGITLPNPDGTTAGNLTVDDLEGYPDSSTGPTGSGEVDDFDISDLPFRFNPPLHPSARHLRTDLGGENPDANLDRFYDEAGNRYDADFAVRTGTKKTGFEKLRLGRLVMTELALARGIVEGGKRYGFRFLYNPTQLSGSLNVNANFIPDPRATNTVVLQQGLENFTFEILINRIPDIQSRAKKGDYIPTISAYDRDRIQAEGTHYDLDFLYRCANGIHNTRSKKQTGDIGVLLPNPLNLIIGPYTSRGSLQNIRVTDEMFSGDMVPMLTRVSITFARHLMTADPTDEDRLASFGIAREDSAASMAEAGTSGNAYSPSTGYGQSLTGKAVYDYARHAGFTMAQADIMTQIAWEESTWKTNAFNGKGADESYGLWQINMKGDMGPDRRKRWGLSRNDELFDPTTNARAARSLFLSRNGYGDWSTYNNGAYKNVRITWR